jgi:hypothetical protein
MFRQVGAILRGGQLPFNLLSSGWGLGIVDPPEDGNHLPKHVAVEFGTH